MSGHTADDYKQLLTEARLGILPAHAQQVAGTLPSDYFVSLFPEVRRWRPLLELVQQYVNTYYVVVSNEIADPRLRATPEYQWLKWACGLPPAELRQKRVLLEAYLEGTQAFLDNGILTYAPNQVVRRDMQQLLAEIGKMPHVDLVTLGIERPAPVFITYALDGLELVCMPDVYGAAFYAHAASLPDNADLFWDAITRRLAAFRFFLPERS